MRRLFAYIRRHGVRDGWFLWTMDLQTRRHQRTWRTFHGEQPRFTGYRRRA